MRVLDATVTRRTRSGDILGPDQRVDVITALKAMTLWAAQQHEEARDKGSIEVGKLADLVILSADPTAVPQDEIDRIKVQETIKEGQTIFALTAQEQRRASLMLRSGSGVDPFNRFLDTASVHREFLRTVAPFTPRSDELLRSMMAAPRPAGCIHDFLFQMTHEMLG